jgi:hypothetical protein
MQVFVVANKFGIWAKTGGFLMFLSARIKNYRERPVCPEVSKNNQ